MSEAKRYSSALVRGDIAVCESIEKQYNVYGYPPEIVSVMLSMIDAVKERDQLRTELERARKLLLAIDEWFDWRGDHESLDYDIEQRIHDWLERNQ